MTEQEKYDRKIWDDAQKQARSRIRIKSLDNTLVPPAPSLRDRLAICMPCSDNQGITEKLQSVFVKCRRCTTCERGRSLTAINQTCPAGKW